jgi:hypothetical protein
VNDNVANKCKNGVSANVCLLDPTNNVSTTQACDNDEIIVRSSIRSPRTASPSCYSQKSFTSAAHALWGKPTQEYLNAITILQLKPLLTLERHIFSSWTV